MRALPINAQRALHSGTVRAGVRALPSMPRECWVPGQSEPVSEFFHRCQESAPFRDSQSRCPSSSIEAEETLRSGTVREDRDFFVGKKDIYNN